MPEEIEVSPTGQAQIVEGRRRSAVISPGEEYDWFCNATGLEPVEWQRRMYAAIAERTNYLGI